MLIRSFAFMDFNKTIANSIFILVLAGLVISCGKSADTSEGTVEENKAPTATSVLHDEVMAIHDEVMPKMDQIMRLKTALREKLELAKQQSAGKEKVDTLEQAILKLEEADEAMMQWMRDFQSQKDAADQQKAVQYYKEQKVAITQVKEKMLTAIQNGTEVLSKSTE